MLFSSFHKVAAGRKVSIAQTERNVGISNIITSLEVIAMRKFRGSAPAFWLIGTCFIILGLAAVASTGFLVTMLILGAGFAALGFRPRKVADVEALKKEFSEEAIIICGKSGDAWVLDNGVLTIVAHGSSSRKSIPVKQIQKYESRLDGNLNHITITAGIPDASVHIGAGVSVAGGNKEMIMFFDEEIKKAKKMCDMFASHTGGTASTPAAAPVEAAPAGSEADEIAKYKALLDSGALSQEEFDAKKKQLLGL